MTTVGVTQMNWSCEQILGTGGFGIVKLWVNKQTGRKLAIKQCKWDDSQLTPRQKTRWTNEVEIMKRLTHPNIVKAEPIPFKIEDIDNNIPLLCMEYCKMGDLRNVLNKAENCCGLKEFDAMKVMNDILSAVKYLHSYKITHRDLKPENVVLQAVNDTTVYKLIDLGYAKEIGEASTSASIVGTLNYVAPELLWDKKYSCSVDYWSLGILFYEILTGKRPFLPHHQHTIAWMEIVKNKSYDDICAYECGDKILFRQDIEEPVDLSGFVRSAMVEWFKVVLQWDPKQRGKQMDENGISSLVVFSLLESTLSHKILYVFFPSLYTINAYVINSSTPATELQLLIEKNMHIPVDHQILTDYNGNALLNDRPLLSQISTPILFIFQSGNILLKNIPSLNMPSLVQKMMFEPKNQVSFEILEDYYRATIFLTKHELHLFQLYIFALCIKVDLITARLVKFGECMENTLKKAAALAAEVNLNKAYYINQGKQDKIEALEENSKKVNTLLTAANQIKFKFAALNEDNDMLQNIAQRISTKDLSVIYDQALNEFESFKKTRNRSGTPITIVTILFDFIKVRQALFHEQNIVELTSRIVNLENELAKLEGSFDSVIAMTTKYQQDLQLIIKKESDAGNSSLTNEIVDFDQLMKSNDDLIYENLIVQYTVDNLMKELQNINWEVDDLDP